MQRQQQQRAALLLLALFFSVIPSLTGGTIAADEDERPNLQRGGLEHGDYHAEMDSYDERELKCQGQKKRPFVSFPAFIYFPFEVCLIKYLRSLQEHRR